MPYSIIGADEKEYGPVDTETLVKWAIQGRVVERTQVRDHESGRRFLACDMAELNVVFSPPPAALQPVADTQPVIPTYPVYPPARYLGPPRSRIVAGLLGILLGWLGVHRFYLGYTNLGVLQLLLGTVVAFFTCGLSLVVVALWGAIEGILCLLGVIPDADGRPLTL